MFKDTSFHVLRRTHLTHYNLQGRHCYRRTPDTLINNDTQHKAIKKQSILTAYGGKYTTTDVEGAGYTLFYRESVVVGIFYLYIGVV